MSTKPGGKLAMDDALADAKRELEAATAEEEQLDLLDPISPEEMADAQEQLGASAGRIAVLRQARVNRRGRPKGARNRRTDDMVNYLSQFGPDPAVALMQIIATPPEVLVERSAAMDPPKKRLSYGEAQGMRVRAAETVMPYFHGKQPVRVDATIRGVVVKEEIGELRPVHGVTLDGDVLGTLPLGDDGDGDDA